MTEVLTRSPWPSFRVVVPEAAHLSFTDAGLYLPPLPSLIGTGGRSATIRITQRASSAFLDATLRGADPTTGATTLAGLGEVTAYGR